MNLTPKSDKLFTDLKLQRRDEQKKAVKKTVKHWCSTTTVHGYAFISDQKQIVIRTIWILITVGAMVYMTVTLYQFIQTYLEYDVVVNYVTVIDSPADFPAVTFCNLNPIDVTNDPTNGAYLSTILKNNQIPPDLTVEGTNKSIYVVEQAAEILKSNIVGDTHLNSTQLENLGFTLDTMLISCYFNGIECNSTDFTWIRSFDYGNCYTFNGLKDSNGKSRTMKKTSKPGPTNGLRLELFLGVAGSQDYYTYRRGAFIIVHNQSTTVPLFKYQGVTAKTGAATNIAISRTFYSKLGSPYSDCRDNVDEVLSTDSKIFSDTVSLSKYNQKLCYEICLQYKYIVPNCGCYDPSIPLADKNVTICAKKETISCVNTQRTLFDKSKMSDSCGQYCPMECDTAQYNIHTSAAVFPTNYYKSILIQDSDITGKFTVKNEFKPSSSISKTAELTNVNLAVSGELKKKSFLKIGLPPQTTVGSGSMTVGVAAVTSLPAGNAITNAAVTSLPNSNASSSVSISTQLPESVALLYIYYDKLRYTQVEDSQAIGFDSFSGTLGGQVGLFMGASFLSFAEFIQLIIDVIYELRDRSSSLNVVQKNSSTKVDDVKEDNI